jgi:hypothetical protein
MSEAATTALTTIPRNPSLGSLSSLVSFSYTAEKSHAAGHPHLITAPCTRCGHAEPIKSLLSVVEKSLLRCQHCHNHPAVLLENSPDENHEDVVDSLHRTFADLENTLRRHGAELERLSQMYPTFGSREPSLRSVATVASTSVEEKRCYGGGHPIVHDVEDLKQFTSGVTRLMRTLHGQVSRLERQEKALRAEREEVAREREELARLREGFGGDGAVSRGRLSKVCFLFVFAVEWGWG